MSDAKITVILFFVLLFMGFSVTIFNLAFSDQTVDQTSGLEADISGEISSTSGWGALGLVDLALTIGKIFLTAFLWSFGAIPVLIEIPILGIRIMFIWMVLRTIRGN